MEWELLRTVFLDSLHEAAERGDLETEGHLLTLFQRLVEARAKAREFK